jgi:hypothetical protein
MLRLSLPLVAAVIALSGCAVGADAPGTQRTVLLAPDFVASAAAGQTDDPQAKWLLNQSHDVREGYVNEVLDREGDDDLLAQAWLLHQPDDVRASYIRDVIEPQLR